VKNRKLVLTVYPEAKCVTSETTVLSPKTFFAIFDLSTGRPISNEWHSSRSEAWKDAAIDINRMMMRKLEN